MLIRLLTVFALILTAACGQDVSPDASDETAANGPAAAATQSPASAPAAVRERSPSPPGAMAYIISPADGETVSSPVRVLFGLKGAGVVPAGIEREGAGHHHLLIDTGVPDLNSAVPADTNHRHFGGGQTEVEIDLEPGTHTLQLLLGDELHVPHDPPILSEAITITVR
jgi:hypothetical protein